MKRYVIDIEADSLHPTQIWCVITVDIDDASVHVARTEDDFHFDKNALYIGHNIIGYDLPALCDLWGLRFNRHHIIDTLVCSRLFNFTAAGGHSLDRWGERLSFKKTDFTEWEPYQDPVQEAERLARCIAYCTNDCKLTAMVFRRLERTIYSDKWKDALRTEHDMAFICRDIHENGFLFDIEKAKEIEEELRHQVSALLEALKEAFPPRTKLIREVTPRATKFGTISRNSIPGAIRDSIMGGCSVDNPFSYLEYIPFNPGSSSQVVERLNEAGWKPFEKTEGHKDAEKELSALRRMPRAVRDDTRIAILEASLKTYEVSGWKVSEENLETLPETAPEGCQLLVKWRMLSKRLQTVEEWLRAFNATTNRIHGNYNHIGAWTHRMSHSDPNQGNVPSVASKYHNPALVEAAKSYGARMRSCFLVPDSSILVGVDADGIQLRILAHYMDDAEFTEALVNGRKEDGTDAHTLNAIALDLAGVDRDRSKTFIYAWLLGAGLGKVAKILGCSNAEAAEAINRFVLRYPGLQRLKFETIPADAARGYFIGLDGRIIHSDEYHMLAGYLQAGEAVIMKSASLHWQEELKREHRNIKWKLVNFVHDEWQTEVLGPRYCAETVAKSQVEAIAWAGRRVRLKCPLAGTAKFGGNWLETH